MEKLKYSFIIFFTFSISCISCGQNNEDLIGEWKCENIELINDSLETYHAKMYIENLKWNNIEFVNDKELIIKKFRTPNRKKEPWPKFYGHSPYSRTPIDNVILPHGGCIVDEDELLKIEYLSEDSLCVNYSFHGIPFAKIEYKKIEIYNPIPNDIDNNSPENFTGFWYDSKKKSDWVLNLEQEGNELNGIITSVKNKMKVSLSGKIMGSKAYVKLNYGDHSSHLFLIDAEMEHNGESLDWYVKSIHMDLTSDKRTTRYLFPKSDMFTRENVGQW